MDTITYSLLMKKIKEVEEQGGSGTKLYVHTLQNSSYTEDVGAESFLTFIDNNSNQYTGTFSEFLQSLITDEIRFPLIMSTLFATGDKHKVLSLDIDNAVAYFIADSGVIKPFECGEYLQGTLTDSVQEI